MIDALEPCRLTTGGCTGDIGAERLGEVAAYLSGSKRASLAGLHTLLDRLGRLGDRLPLDTDEPMLLPLFPAVVDRPADQLASARDRVDELADRGSAAARVIAALVLRRIDRDAGEQALRRLAGDRTELWLGSGDGEVYLAVGELVRRFLDPSIVATLPPPPPRPDPTLVRPEIPPETWWQRFKGWLVSLG